MEEVEKALREGRGECLGCTAAAPTAAPANEVAAFSASLDAPEYPSEKD